TVSNIGVCHRKLSDQWHSMQLHICYLRSLEDTYATRDACLRFLQTWLCYFYPERPDIVTEIQKLATKLGGQMRVPQLRWKYAWIGVLFGRSLARRAEMLLQRTRWWFIRRL